jgi:hypothetical protein
VEVEILAGALELDNSVYLTQRFESAIRELQERAKAPEAAPVTPKSRAEAERLQQALLVARTEKEASERDTLAAQQKMGELQRQLDQKLRDRASASGSVWSKEAKGLDEEYRQRHQEFKATLETRAKQLSIQWPETWEVDEPDVVVSAFRLGLYRLSAQVDKSAELKWAETQLAAWRSYVADWSARRTSVREKAQSAQVELDPEIQEIREQLTKLENSTAPDQKKREAATEKLRQAEMAQAQFQAKQEKETPPKTQPPSVSSLLEEMNALPEKYRIVAARRIASGQFVFERLEQRPEIKSGSYLVFVRARKGADLYWAFVPVSIQSNTTTSLRINERFFEPINSFLEQSKPSPQTNEKP